jgi:hypothetical protein
MSSINTGGTRRRFLQASLVGLAAVQMSVTGRSVAAAELPHLDEADSSAKALAYVHDASAISVEVRGGEDRVCTSCRFYIKHDVAWGPCNLFPGKAVAAQGWCKGWVAKA